MKNVMVDLETLSTTTDACIVSIGACKFNPDTGEIGETFYKTIDLNTQTRSVSIDTIKWWLQQTEAASEEIFKEGTHLKVALKGFHEWLPNGTIIWSNGATFDVIILEDAYKSFGLTKPWDFWNVRDVRTVVAMAAGILSKGSVALEGEAHNALDDAIYQADYVSKMWRALRGPAQKLVGRK